MKTAFTNSSKVVRTAKLAAAGLGMSFLAACTTSPYEQRPDLRGASTLAGCGAGLLASGGRHTTDAQLIGGALLGCAAGALVGEAVSGPPQTPVYVTPSYPRGAYYGGGYYEPQCHTEYTGNRVFSHYDEYGRPRFSRERIQVCR